MAWHFGISAGPLRPLTLTEQKFRGLVAVLTQKNAAVMVTEAKEEKRKK